MTKLMKPLFIGGKYNKEGKKIRANYIKTVGEYPLWVHAGKPDKDYTSDEKDKYYLHLEFNDWLVPLGETEYSLTIRAGEHKLIKEWYGDHEGRQKYFDDNFYKGRTFEESNRILVEHVAKEQLFIEKAGARDDVRVEFIESCKNRCMNNYIKQRNNKENYVDFVGALLLGKLEECEEIRDEIMAKRDQEEAEKNKIKAEIKRREEVERIEKEKLLVDEAEQIFISGGKIDGGDMIIKLADRHGVVIPIKTRGWILNSLAETTIIDNFSYRYYKRKSGRGSQKVFEIYKEIRKAILKNSKINVDNVSNV
jgi:hypothetical protein